MYDMYPGPADWHTVDEPTAHRAARRPADTERGTARHARPATTAAEQPGRRDSTDHTRH